MHQVRDVRSLIHKVLLMMELFVFSNYRSVMSRLWPWCWSGEKFTRLMDEFDYFSGAESVVNLEFRITLISISFKAMTSENAKQPQKPPMG